MLPHPDDAVVCITLACQTAGILPLLVLPDAALLPDAAALLDSTLHFQHAALLEPCAVLCGATPVYLLEIWGCAIS